MTAEIVPGDMRALLPLWKADGLRFSCCITDPPYHLASIAKRFGKPDSAPAQHGRDGAAARLSRGFMGSATDEGTISFSPDTWRLVLDVLNPGGRLLCFGGTRTWWKTAAAIDAAGFEIEDTIMWVYGQGLVLRRSRLKPAYEPILLCRKPGPVQDLNINDCRVGNQKNVPASPSHTDGKVYGKNASLTAIDTEGRNPNTGRWPANLIHDNSDEVLACMPDAPGQIADASATAPSDKTSRVYGRLTREGEASADRRYTSSGGTNFAAKPGMRRADSGSAARFFTACEFTEDEKRLLYHPKAPGSQRCYRCTICGEDCLHAGCESHRHGRDDLAHLHGHPTVKPLSLLRHLVRLACPADGLVLDPFSGTGTTLLAAALEGRDSVGIERDERYVAHGRLRLTDVA